jgi:hypothetical protein
MESLWQELLTFILQFSDKFMATITGGIFASGLLLWERYKRGTVEYGKFLAILFIALNVSSFQIWRDEHHQLLSATARLNAYQAAEEQANIPRINIDRVITYPIPDRKKEFFNIVLRNYGNTSTRTPTISAFFGGFDNIATVDEENEFMQWTWQQRDMAPILTGNEFPVGHAVNNTLQASFTAEEMKTFREGRRYVYAFIWLVYPENAFSNARVMVTEFCAYSNDGFTSPTLTLCTGHNQTYASSFPFVTQ